MPEQAMAVAPAAGGEGVRRFNAPLGQRFASTLGSYNADARSVELTVATETMVKMPGYALGLCEDYYEILDCSPQAVDFSQVEAGNAAVLDTHNNFSVRDMLGRLQNGRCEGNQVLATCMLGQSDAARSVEAEIAGGTPPKVSAGYRRDQAVFERFEGEIPVYRITRWTLVEASFCPIAVDPNAGVRSASADAFPCTIEKERSMDPNQNGSAAGAASDDNQNGAATVVTPPENGSNGQSSADGQRAASGSDNGNRVVRFSGTAALVFVDQARAFGDDVVTRAQELVAQNGRGEITIDAANAALLRASADAQRSATGAIAGGGRAVSTVTQDERDKFRQGAENSIILRAGLAGLFTRAAEIKGIKIDLDPGEYRGIRNVDLARLALEKVGERVDTMDPDEIVKRAIAYRSGPYQTTSDFPVLLESVVHKSLQAAYTVAPDTWRRFAGTTSVQDFRDHNRYLRGTFGRLDDVLEDGEIKNKAIPDGAKEKIRATPKGNIVGLTRQAIVNDDMGVFNQVSTDLGRAAKLSIEIDVFALLALNAGLGPVMNDGLTMFHANHGNIGTGAAVSVAAFDELGVLMSQQKDISGNEYVEFDPAVLVLNRGHRGDAQVINEAQYDTSVSNKFQVPNKVRGMFRDIVGTPRVAGNRYYAFADPDVAPAIEVAFLNGVQEPMLDQREGWRVDGVEWRIRFDYGVGAVNWRAAATNAGQ